MNAKPILTARTPHHHYFLLHACPFQILYQRYKILEIAAPTRVARAHINAPHAKLKWRIGHCVPNCHVFQNIV